MTRLTSPRGRYGLALCLALDAALAHFGCGTHVGLGARHRGSAGAAGDVEQDGTAGGGTAGTNRPSSSAAGGSTPDDTPSSGAPGDTPSSGAPGDTPSSGGSGARTMIAVGGSTTGASGAAGASDEPPQSPCTSTPSATDASNYTASSQPTSAVLTRLVPLRVPVGTATLRLDWRQLEHDAYGDAFVPSDITSLDIYELAASVEELDGGAPLRLEELAQASWHGDTGTSRSFELLDAVDDQGAAFPGIDYEHTWLVALRCAACEEPLPPYLSMLVTCDRCGDGKVETADGEQCDLGDANGKSAFCTATCQAAPR